MDHLHIFAFKIRKGGRMPLVSDCRTFGTYKGGTYKGVREASLL